MFNDPSFKATDCCSVTNTYIQNKRLDCLMVRTSKFDDSKAEGEYFTLDLKKWIEVDNHWIDENRIGVGRTYGNSEVKVFIQISEEENITKCKHYILFSRDNYLDLRKSRGEDKHRNVRITTEGTIWIGNEFGECEIKTFVKRAAK